MSDNRRRMRFASSLMGQAAVHLQNARSSLSGGDLVSSGTNLPLPHRYRVLMLELDALQSTCKVSTSYALGLGTKSEVG